MPPPNYVRLGGYRIAADLHLPAGSLCRAISAFDRGVIAIYDIPGRGAHTFLIDPEKGEYKMVIGGQKTNECFFFDY